MRNELILNKWLFKMFKIDEKEDLINKIASDISINSMKEDLQPFRTPGSLQSNIVETMNLNPYFEDNMKKLEYLEEYYLLLITQFSNFFILSSK